MELNLITANNNQKILSSPIKSEPSPSVEKPNYYGNTNDAMFYQVSSKKNDDSQY